MKMTRAHVVVSGLVQGVFFRLNACKAAKEGGVKGWVKNTPNGTVEALFEGSEDKVKKLLEWCRKGPDGARVDAMDVKWEDYQGEFKDFSINYGRMGRGQ